MRDCDESGKRNEATVESPTNNSRYYFSEKNRKKLLRASDLEVGQSADRSMNRRLMRSISPIIENGEMFGSVIIEIYGWRSRFDAGIAASRADGASDLFRTIGLWVL